MATRVNANSFGFNLITQHGRQAGDPLSTYRYSYSGTDVRTFAYFSDIPDSIIELESIHTISWSVHEAKGVARALGFNGVKGFARGARTCAGSIITTVIEDHPFAKLMELYINLSYGTETSLPRIGNPTWSVDVDILGTGNGINPFDLNRRLATKLPPINIFLSYTSELGIPSVIADPNDITSTTVNYGAGVLLVGLDFLDEGAVTSVSDSATEMTYSFFARDIKTLSRGQNTSLGNFAATPYGQVSHFVNPPEGTAQVNLGGAEFSVPVTSLQDE